MNNIRRESKDRTRSERLIDRHLSLDHITPETVKKAKLDEGISETKINSQEFFAKIKKHLSKKTSVQKSISVLSKFIKAYALRIDSSEIYSCLNLIFSQDLSNIFPSQHLSTIFDLINGRIIFEEPAQNQLSIWSYITSTFNQMHTDDTSLFHKILKSLDQKLDDPSNSTEFTLWFGKGLVTLKKYLSIPWSRTALLTFLRKCYRKLPLFDKNAQEEILEMLDMQITQCTTESVREILTSGHEVVDNRIEIKSTNSLDTWAEKQSK